MPLRHAFQETYLEVEHIIDAIARRYSHPVRYPYPVMKSEANLAFIRAYNSFDSNKAAFQTWLTFKVRKGLEEYIRQDRLVKKMHWKLIGEKVLDIPDYRIGHYEPDLDFMKFISKDAKVVVGLVFKSPKELMNLVAKQGRVTPLNFKIALKDYLESLGWGGSRIRQSFNEIKEALHA